MKINSTLVYILWLVLASCSVYVGVYSVAHSGDVPNPIQDYRVEQIRRAQCDYFFSAQDNAFFAAELAALNCFDD